MNECFFCVFDAMVKLYLTRTRLADYLLILWGCFIYSKVRVFCQCTTPSWKWLVLYGYSAIYRGRMNYLLESVQNEIWSSFLFKRTHVCISNSRFTEVCNVIHVVLESILWDGVFILGRCSFYFSGSINIITLILVQLRWCLNVPSGALLSCWERFTSWPYFMLYKKSVHCENNTDRQKWGEEEESNKLKRQLYQFQNIEYKLNAARKCSAANF